MIEAKRFGGRGDSGAGLQMGRIEDRAPFAPIHFPIRRADFPGAERVQENVKHGNYLSAVWLAIVSAILTLLLFLITLILRWLHDLHTTPPRVIHVRNDISHQPVRSQQSLLTHRLTVQFLHASPVDVRHQGEYVTLLDASFYFRLLFRRIRIIRLFRIDGWPRPSTKRWLIQIDVDDIESERILG
uniref:Uncharacterized protein n=1 Tax=Anopheles culicifacies TaxID=139723 RepID=A0A182MU45_9DIPT